MDPTSTKVLSRDRASRELSNDVTNAGSLCFLTPATVRYSVPRIISAHAWAITLESLHVLGKIQADTWPAFSPPTILRMRKWRTRARWACNTTACAQTVSIWHITYRVYGGKAGRDPTGVSERLAPIFQWYVLLDYRPRRQVFVVRTPVWCN